jgi:hypothetical protein
VPGENHRANFPTTYISCITAVSLEIYENPFLEYNAGLVHVVTQYVVRYVQSLFHRVRASVSSLNLKYLLLSSRSLVAAYVFFLYFCPSCLSFFNCFRSQFLRKIRPIQLTSRFRIVYAIVISYPHTVFHI